jgi:hypothetical protein
VLAVATTVATRLIIIIVIIIIITVSETFRQYLSNKLGKHEIKELQGLGGEKIVILGTRHTLQKVLM